MSKVTSLMMTDAFARFQPLQGPGYSVLKPDGTTDTDLLLPLMFHRDRAIDVPGRRVLDAGKPDGLNVRMVEYTDIPGGLADEHGTVLVAEREKGTQLFLMWVSRTAALHLKGRTPEKVNVHFLFHPPTYRECYTESTYWTGTCGIDGKDRYCVDSGFKGQQPYVQLGERYLCTGDTGFRAVAQHLLASDRLEPNVIYVVPVASTRGGNFDDLLTAEALARAVQDVIIFASRKIAGSPDVDGFVDFGEVMLSGYSHSGDRVEKLLLTVSDTPFFRRHLSQINLFDPNLDEKDARIRLVRFKALLEKAALWKKKINRDARIFVYTSYGDHQQAMLGSDLKLESPTVVNLDTVDWSVDRSGARPSKRAKGARPRGSGVEAYDHDRTVGLVHIPVAFFRHWLEDKLDNPSGWDQATRDSGHGHGWILRTLMSHALSHAAPSWFGAQRGFKAATPIEKSKPERPVLPDG
ncbi:hypothetical protein [Streptomyces cellostaticus]|uniref:hypothetical protein n=1 Tax=Streptomyces cellostaticus TaxID=67285 RepID=UPI002027080D|nr:hypothetical protein [Streptomyces cellostaticus]